MDGSHTAGLGPECQRLQSGLPPAGAAVRAFISAHPETQVRLSPLAEELLCLPDVVAALLRSAAGCEGEDRFLLEARQVPGVCADIVRQVEGAFPEGGGSSRWSLRKDDAWRSAAERASALGSCLATGRRIMSLAVDALDL